MNPPPESERAGSEAFALETLGALCAAGHRAYLVGGCVRDRLLGITPGDYDIATSARSQEILALFSDAVEVGASFGVVLRRRAHGEVQIATFRREGAYADGRRPSEVDFVAGPEEDAARRDFTINALFEDPFRSEVLDFYGGRGDLAAGWIRAVGDPERRFAEDHLRMLRAVRFAARLGFSIEAGTYEAIRRGAPQIKRISAERIRDEISRILTEGGARRGMELLRETGLLREILPEAEAMKGVAQPPEFHPEGDVWTHTMGMLDLAGRPSITLALGILFHDIGKPETQTVTDRIRFNGHVEAGVRIAREAMARLRYSGEEIQQVEALVANHMKFMHVGEMRESTRKRFLRMPRFDEHLELHRVDCLSSHRKLGNYEIARQALAETPPEELRPPPLLTGHDLIRAGYSPSARFKEILGAVEEMQLDGTLGSHEEALAWVRAHYPVAEENRDNR